MKTKQNRSLWLGALAMGLVCLLAAGLLGSVGLVRGEEASQAESVTPVTKYIIEYRPGSYVPVDSNVSVPATFTAKAGTTELTPDASGCITLPATFAETVTVGGLADNQKLDVETFYFDTYNQAAVEAGTLWAYTFTCWQIGGTGTNRIAGETVLQPGFVVPPEVLEKYAVNNGDGTASLTLVAKWGKCYFIQNPYENMVYETIDYKYPLKTLNNDKVTYTYAWKSEKVTALNMTASAAASGGNSTGAYDVKDGVKNAGNNPNAPLASIECLLDKLETIGDPYDANAIAIMLTGDLDYIQDRNAGYGRSNFIDSYLAQDTNNVIKNGCLATTGYEWTGDREQFLPPTVDNGFIDDTFYNSSNVYRYSAGQGRPFGQADGVAANKVAGFTFKSLQTQEDPFTFRYKTFNDECQFYSSVRFDNVKLDAPNGSDGTTFMGENLGNICRLYNSTRTGYTDVENGTHYFEVTARLQYNAKAASNKMYFPLAYLRSDKCETVVLCGGCFGYLNIAWGDPGTSERDRSWYVGGNVSLNNLYPGTVDSTSEETITSGVDLIVTGGTVSNIYGGSNSPTAKAIGDRVYRIYGAEGRQPQVTNLVGGAPVGLLKGNVDILVTNCTVGNVYGGGRDFSATVQGNITVTLENTTVTGDVYGGGKYGCCEDNPDTADVTEGNASVNILDSTVSGTIYGSGRGNVNSVTAQIYEKTGYNNKPDDWETAPDGFPVRNSDGSYTTHIYRSITWVSGEENMLEGVKWNKTSTIYSFSMAEVENTQILIENSQVKNVYGGGSTAVVNGDTSIIIRGSSKVDGNVYGGGDGTAAAGGVPIYKPVEGTYTAPYVTLETVDGKTVPVIHNSPVHGVKVGTYKWSNDTSKFAGTPGEAGFTGINEEEGLLYTSYDASQAGQVLGSTSVSIEDSTQITGTVYGGGNAGAVLVNTTVTLSDSAQVAGEVYGGGNAGAVGGKATVSVSGSPTISGNVYGGGNAGAVNSTRVTVSGGTVTQNLFGGGNAAGGVVNTTTTVNISGGNLKTDVFGGGNAGPVNTSTTINITGGNFAGTVYGGGRNGLVGTKGTNVNITGPQDGVLEFTGRKVYGGGYEGAVNNVARIKIENVTFPKVTKGASGYIFGGGSGSNARVDAASVTLTNVTIPRLRSEWGTVTSGYDGAVYGGGNAGPVRGNVSLTIENCQIDANVYGGGGNADVGGNVTVKATDLLSSTGHSDVAGKPEYSFYGGGREGNVTGSVTLNITDGQFDWFYGGGQNGDVGDITLTMNGTKKYVTDVYAQTTYNGDGGTTVKYQPYVAWCFRAGGNSGTAGAVNVTVNQGWYRRNAHMGGSAGVTTSTDTVINGGHFSAGLFGGVDSGAVLGKCKLTINKVTSESSIYGGGDQPSSRVGQTHVIINDATLKLTGSQVIYGGSDQGWVVGAGTSTSAMGLSDGSYYENTAAVDRVFTADSDTVCLVEFNAGSVPTIFGGSKGTADSNTTGAKEKLGNVNGNTALIIRGGTVTSAYGGNNANGTISGSTNLTVSGGAVTNAFGGSNAGGTINGGTNLTVSDGTVENAYGGNNKAGTVNNGTNVSVENGAVTNVFGGSNAGATINGGTNLNISGGTVRSGYGGCNTSGTIYGVVQTNFTGGNVTAGLYGGGYQADIAENTAEKVAVNISGSANAYTEDVWVFGGGNEADCYAPIAVTMDGGQVLYVAGGCKAATCVTTDVQISGGTVSSVWGGGDMSNSRVTKDTKVTISGTAKINATVRGGGNLGSVDGDTVVVMTGGSVADRINGGGNKGVVGGNAYVTVSGGTVNNVFGGGDSDKTNGVIETATVKKNTYITISGGNVTGMVCGGGNRSWSTVEGDANVTVEGGKVATVYGGGNEGPVSGNSSVTVSKTADISGDVYGGGNAGTVGLDANVTVTGGEVAGHVYGGGNAGLVDANSFVTVSGGTLSGNVFGGGKEGPVDGRATVIMDGGFVLSSLYGGGQEGTVGTTEVQLLDDASVQGNVFGGGQGVDATVRGTTAVTVNLNFDFQVTETPVDTTHITPSGMVHAAVTSFASAEYGYIGGSIYGGGDLARVGDGTISTGGDKATISVIGRTHVTVTNGQIAGSVFGGGRGIPAQGTTYNFYMGAVFGSTTVTVNGGLIGANGGSIYGGGEQSRVYGLSSENACTVSLVEIENHKIAVNGSVFGGGDRGESATSNASVPTVYGDVSVLIQGIKDQKPSNIYFLAGLDGKATNGGGVYGDGNLCLVDGYRTITLRHFEPAEQGEGGYVKTFYSLQRADEAILHNSAVVLLGAPDLVEEDDTGLYSINRIGKLSLEQGSVIKLDQVVKYLGGLSSDVHATQKFIHDGNNGRTGTYEKTSCDGSCLDPLTQAKIDAYRSGAQITHSDGTTFAHNADNKNVVCVANGLYLEVIDETNTYGPVTGLFTLQLLYANPGEGGGFVYGSLPQSTGDFICETMSWKFVPVTVADEAAFNELKNDTQNGGLFIRVKGKAFQRPEEFSANETYYTRTSTGEYMEIIDDVGGEVVKGEQYAYYYWYIGGPSVTYQVELTGYIGAANTEFATNTSLPQHDEVERAYVLHSVSVNSEFAQALEANAFELAQTSAVTGQEIAIELRLGGTSLGYLVKLQDGSWGIQQGDKQLAGYNGAQVQALANVLLTTEVDSSNDQLTWVLHKANTVGSTAAGLEVYLDIDLFESKNNVLENVTTGTAMLSYTTEIRIVRMTASQALYHDNLRSYTGVATRSNIHITGNSCFTAEYQTRYVPAAYPGAAGSMVWALSTQSSTYYMSATGQYFTVNSAGKLVNFSEGLTEGMLEAGADAGTYRLKDNHEVIFSAVESFSANALPKNTKITMVDLSGAVPAYYYYICNEAEDHIDLTQFMLMGTKTTIQASGISPAFMAAYAQQGLAVQAERLLFVFDFEQAAKDASEFTGGVVLSHTYGGVDIMDYAKQNAAGANVRSFPEETAYKFHGGQTGVVSASYTAIFQADSYQDGESAVLKVHVEEDGNWINTLFRENGFALKIQLVNANGEGLAMPAGMYFEYKGQKYYPGPDSTYISVPVYEFGDHEITMHNPYFDLQAITGETAWFKTSYYSAPDAGHYNAFNTGVTYTDSYTLTAAGSYHLKVVPGSSQVLAAGQKLSFTYSAYTVNSQAETVKVTALVKTDTGYVAAELDGLFVSAPETLANGTGLTQEWVIAEGAAPGTYRLVFTYGNHTEYLNLIVK